MANLHLDQAEGLRRIMAAGQPRIISILSALGQTTNSVHELHSILSYLASSFAQDGASTHIVYAVDNDPDALKFYGLLNRPSLMDVMLSQRPLEHAVSHIQNDFTASWLGCTQRMNPYLSPQLGEYIHTLAKTHDVVLVEAKVDATHSLPLPLLNDGVIVIQMNEKAASVKQAYSLIKQLHQKLDKAAFGILVHGRTAKNANQVFANVAKVAQQFLGITLDDMGFIPTENPLAQPYKTSNNVSHARPSAGIANIYHEIAKRLLRQPLTLTALDTTPTI